MPRPPRHLPVVALLAAACGGRAEGTFPGGDAGGEGGDPGRPDASSDARPRAPEADAGGGPSREGGTLRDGAPEAPDADARDAPLGDAPGEHDAARDAAADASPDGRAPELPDPGGPCPCHADDFAVSLTLGAAETRLDAPYPLRVYCEETLPLAARDPVTGVVRVSACAGPDSAPPCLYVALAGERLLLGVLVTAEGETLDVVSGSLVASEATPGGLRGELFLEVAGSDGGRSPVGATFRGCDPFRPPPPASGA